MQATSKLILGTVQFGLDYGINNLNGKPNQCQVNEILLSAYKNGITCLDTAEAYGNAHLVIGQFHLQNPTIKFDVITKLPHIIDENIGKKIDRYLSELNVSELNALLFHSFETYFTNRPLLNKLKQFKDSGKVRNLGVSVYTNDQFKQVITDKEIDIIQLPFNLFDNINQRGALLKEAKEKGKIIHTRSAFLQGLFFLPLDNKGKIVQELLTELKHIHVISSKNNLSINKLALNYCLQEECIDNVLIGVDSLKQLEQNVNDADLSLPSSILNDINSIKISQTGLLNPSLWNQ